MRLLISVATPDEARAALGGGADLIDAKDPTRGALGAVPPSVLREICGAIGGERPLSAALGDASCVDRVARAAGEAARAGAGYVKVGFAGTSDPAHAARLLAAAMDGVRSTSAEVGVIAAAYADAERAGSVAPMRIIEVAAGVGAAGVLLDTAFKDGGGLFACLSERAVAAWVRAAREAGLLVALAGRLGEGDLCVVRELGADIAGVRGAACEGGRAGRVSRARVAALVRAAHGGTTPPPAPPPRPYA